MQISMGGDKAYFLEIGEPAKIANIYIFDTDKKDLNCVTIAEQEQYHTTWLESLYRG